MPSQEEYLDNLLKGIETEIWKQRLQRSRK